MNKTTFNASSPPSSSHGPFHVAILLAFALAGPYLTMAADPFADLKWTTIAEVNFDDDNNETLAVVCADPGLKWSVADGVGRIAGTTTVGRWAGCRMTRPIEGDTLTLIEVSGDFRTSGSNGYQLIALSGSMEKAGNGLCMFFEGINGKGSFGPFYKRGYVIQRRPLEGAKIPYRMLNEKNGFSFGNEMEVFHKMRMLLDRTSSEISYYVDDILLGIVKFRGQLGRLTSASMQLQARDTETQLDILYDNIQVRIAGDPYDPDAPLDLKKE
ncbi:MAG: hypothetical protein PHV34_10140 [Verrucomicrobiae bacterium]|nr:hypothetical protein [Verrucomicrobiae bacterium]